MHLIRDLNVHQSRRGCYEVLKWGSLENQREKRANYIFENEAQNRSFFYNIMVEQTCVIHNWSTSIYIVTDDVSNKKLSPDLDYESHIDHHWGGEGWWKTISILTSLERDGQGKQECVIF